MSRTKQTKDFKRLAKLLEGEFFTGISSLLQYATDASPYREVPLAVALPKTKNDLKELILFAKKHRIPLIPRAGGTSLAGQVVGNGIVVDFSKYWNSIKEINAQEKWVIVEPGVILDQLNATLKPYNLFFGPETSTGNRCTLVGMVSNNSCGSHSLVYGSTRDHTLSVSMLLDDGNEYVFGELTEEELLGKQQLSNKEGEIYRQIPMLFSHKDIRQEIVDQLPKPSVKRRNTGYALDTISLSSLFSATGHPLNLSSLIAGSEGTLGFITEIKLNLVPLPPKEKALLCVHLSERNQAFQANLIALKYGPSAVELMDHIILECTKENIEQQKNRYFIEGNPGAILIVELWANTPEELVQTASAIETEMQSKGLGYHFPLITGENMGKVWALRKAGLGVLSNIEGDAKPVSLIEDTAVDPHDLPYYMEDFEALIKTYNLDCVYHAHIGSGELHLRPILNLKDKDDVEIFRALAFEMAHLVKKYNGSLSGEHGDGRLRSELIPLMVGEKVYECMKSIKQLWDPLGIFNPGKIVDSPPMHINLRYEANAPTPQIDTLQDFSSVQGILRAIEKCNGSADCRKTHEAGGTMCPSFMATRNEWNSTRARANVLREFLTHSKKRNPFNHKEIYEILDLCLSCKGCKSECPSNVDMAKLKAEFLHQWYKSHPVPIRTRLIANISRVYSVGSLFPRTFNFFLGNGVSKWFMDKVLGITSQRNLPKLSKTTLRQWKSKEQRNLDSTHKKVYLFADEFTNYTDSHIGIKAIDLLYRLGYEVEIADITESGRAYISKGLLKSAKRIAENNVQALMEKVTAQTPLIGIEPSAILSFRDEYPDLVSSSLRNEAKALSKNCLLFEEFFMREVQAGRIDQQHFNSETRVFKLHGHCQQKAIASTLETKQMLSFPQGYKVEEIPSGCCGMAGSFGFEKEHFSLSMKVGELVLFPEVRKADSNTTIVAVGTSCRQQILDGTSKQSIHPIEALWDAVKK